jgi:hypothetical protein
MNHENLVRERAYQLWEQSGRPDGHSEAFWLQAVADIAAGLASGPIPAPSEAVESAPVMKRTAVRRKAAMGAASRTAIAPADRAVAMVAKAAAKTSARTSSAGMLPS